MNKRLVLMLLVAVVMAGGAANIANNWLEEQMEGNQAAQQGMTRVAAASIEIPYGQKIELAHIKMIDLPEDSVPQGAILESENVVGMVAAQTILPGEMLLGGRVVEHLGGSTLAAVIEPGKRAVAVRVNEIIGVAGFLLPGNRVDVLASRGGNRSASVDTVLRDIKVLAVDQTSSTDKNEPVIVRAVTLEVTPKQAEVLVKATVQGGVQLALRNPKDDLPVVAEAKEQVAAPRPVKSEYYAPKITLIRGTSVSSNSVVR